MIVKIPDNFPVKVLYLFARENGYCMKFTLDGFEFQEPPEITSKERLKRVHDAIYADVERADD